MFVQVLLTLSLHGDFTYSVPEEFQEKIAIGKRVFVQFGGKKRYSALIVNILKEIPFSHYKIKHIEDVIDEFPIVNQQQIEFWQWISSYYLCTMGEVMQAALPSSLKLTSETKISINPKFEKDYTELNDNEYLIAEALESNNFLEITDIIKILNKKNVIPIIKSLIEKGVVISNEEIQNDYKPKTEIFLSFHPDYKENNKLRDLFDSIERKAPKQLDILIAIMQISRKLDSINFSEVPKKKITEIFPNSDSVIATLVKKGILQSEKKAVNRIKSYAGSINTLPELTAEQQRVSSEIDNLFENKNIVLLHGVTASGKTEVYIHKIQDCIAQGKQVLYLLPEIALTAQLINRLQRIFGNRVGVYHSKFNENERAEVWYRMIKPKQIQDKYDIIIGARSSIFLPFDNLGLVIVDEEHDSSYKQSDPQPRYNARDIAIYLAQKNQAKVILGSATPSLDSYYNALTDKYGLTSLPNRYGGVLPPHVELVNMRELKSKKLVKAQFSETLLNEIESTLKRKEQVILFQNRRGFSTRLECDDCYHVVECKNCDVIMTYHKSAEMLKCHYCGYQITVPTNCPNCSSTKLLMKGYGTERIDDDLKILLPKARIARMDLDTTRSKNSYLQIINDFEDHNIDILVGTQMITKGLDFDNVGLVGIISADNILNYPDFRAFERSYQLFVQVAGRAGRRNSKGKVLIQTYNVNHQVLQYVLNASYKAFYEFQIGDRYKYKYPPFYRFVEVVFKSKDKNLLDNYCFEIVKQLKQVINCPILGPEYPIISKINNEYLKKIILKFEKGVNLNVNKNILIDVLLQYSENEVFKKVRYNINVDPM